MARRPPSPQLRASLKRIQRATGVRDVGYVAGRLPRVVLLDTPAALNQMMERSRVTERSILRASDGRMTSHLGMRLYGRDKGDWFEEPTYFDALEYALQVLMSIDAPDIMDDPPYVIPIPAPGGPQKTWWSTRHGQWMDPVKVPIYNPCDEPPIRTGMKACDAQLGLSGAKLPIFATHGAQLSDIRRIERCGGMLWPSFAVSWRVPASYGDVVFLADRKLVDDALSGRADLSLHLTDCWSPAGAELSRMAKAITLERRGDLAWWAGRVDPDDGGWGNRGLQNRLLSGSAPVERIVGGWAPDEAWDPVRSRRALTGRLNHLIELYTDLAGDPYDYPERDEVRYSLLHEHGPAATYDYCELKAMGVLPLWWCDAVLFPRKNHRRMNRMLDAMSYHGRRIEVDWYGPPKHRRSGEPATDAQRRSWASAMTDAILAYLEER